jgi:glycosyltransferase involved in cell wall biosynthesis
MLKAAIYDPYLDTLGGGERYCLSIAEILLKQGYHIDIFWDGDKDIISKAKSRFKLDIDNIDILPDIFCQHHHSIDCVSDQETITKMVNHPISKFNLLNKIPRFFKKINITRQYDLFFYLSDWSIPFLFSRHNLLHVQVPFLKKIHFQEKLLNNIKLIFLQKVICNSQFTLQFASRKFGHKCYCLYPPVDVQQFNPHLDKENIILSVGRFDSLLNSKKQDILIDSFLLLLKQNPSFNWKLVLAGGSLQDPAHNSYLLHLQNLAQGLPIEFVVNPDFLTLKKIYESSKIYWHAAGFGVDQNIHPENTEHFGMAPVEAMAAGAVPVLVNCGGLSEIITDGVSGYLWNTTTDLIAKTQLLISSKEKLTQMSIQSQQSSLKFSKESFTECFYKLLP